MHGSQLFGQQPTFSGSDFGVPEIAYFGFVQFRNAIATADGWEDHDGMELVFVRSGEACWDYPDNRLLRVSGGHGAVFPPNHQHRIVNGVYTPCQMLWIEFRSRAEALREARLFPVEELSALYDVVARPSSPVRLSGPLMQSLTALSTLLADDDVMIGSRVLIAEIRATLYAMLIDFWKIVSSGRSRYSVSTIVQSAEAILREDLDNSEDIAALWTQVGCRKSHLYQLFRQELGMTPNDYRQRLRIKQCCEELVHTDTNITDVAIGMGYSSSQYFSRVFKKYVGLTPRAYRQMFGTGNAAL